MRKVTKAEYLKAKRVVDNYMLQQQLGKYQFLYWLEFDIEDDPKEMWIQASNIDTACELFLTKKSSDVARVDYEVMFQGNYYDITDKKGFEDLI